MIKTIAVSLITMSTFQIFSTVNDFHNALPSPVQVPNSQSLQEDSKLTQTKQALFLLERDIKFAEPVYLAAKSCKLDPVLFACLIEKESEFNILAVSKKGYKGLGQTPVAMRKQGYEIVDLVLAACILREKLNSGYAKGNMLKALQLYKGGKNPEALKYAKETYDLYKEIKAKLV
jgi:hypothetical protein